MTQPLSQPGSAEAIAEIGRLNERISSEVQNWTLYMSEEIAAALWPAFLDSTRVTIAEYGSWNGSLKDLLAEHHSATYRSVGHTYLSIRLASGIAAINVDTPLLLTRLGNLIARQFTLMWNREIDDPVEQFSALHVSEHPCESECNKWSCNDILFRSKDSLTVSKKKLR